MPRRRRRPSRPALGSPELAAAAAPPAPDGITVGAARTYQLDGLPSRRARSPRGARQSSRSRSRSLTARRSRLPARPGPPYGRPPDHRQGRPLDDRPRPSAGRRRREDPPGRRPALLRPLSGRGRRLSREHADGPDQLPALRRDHRQRRLPPRATGGGGFGAAGHGRRLPVHAAPARAAARDRACVPHDHRARPERAAGEFTPWYGALAHAIFFRKGSLDYFHTHVCSAGAVGCTSALGATKVTGSSTTPGRLTVGVLVPVAGTWRLFLQCQVNGHS